MQGQDTQKSNVISLFENRNKETPVASADKAAGSPSEPSFLEIMKQNAKNKERMERERASANKSVLRSYRIKH